MRDYRSTKIRNDIDEEPVAAALIDITAIDYYYTSKGEIRLRLFNRG